MMFHPDNVVHADADLVVVHFGVVADALSDVVVVQNFEVG